MKPLKTFVFLLSILLLTGSCKDDGPTVDSELSNIDLLRGDVILCSGEKFGEVSFSLGCKRSVRKTFELALSLLHSFEYSEAEKAFVQIIDADPECAMAYWGVAMSIYHALWFAPSQKELEKGSKLVEIAQGLSKSTKEQMYLDAIASFYQDHENIDHKTRAIRFEKQMEKLYEKYGEDTEVAVFYALALNSTADVADENYSNNRKAGKILESLFINQPNHPGIAHYLIHNYDNPILASKALTTARRYAAIAPSSSHAQHMPSHIFTRMGLWKESIHSNLNSASSAQCFSESAGLEGYLFHEIHAIDYLVYAYLQKGDNIKAMKEHDYIKTMEKLVPVNIPGIAYPFAAIPTRIALENKNWAEATQLKPHSSDIKWEKYPWQKAILHFGRALGAAHTHESVLAKEELEILKALRQDLLKKDQTYMAQQVMIQINGAEAWIQFENGNQDEGLVLMEEAVRLEKNTTKHPVTPCEVLPAEELMGDMLLAMNKFSEALVSYEENLKVHPNRFNGIYGAAVASRESGNDNKAKMYFKDLLELSDGSESQRVEIAEARAYLEAI